jgi:hypothetical protein
MRRNRAHFARNREARCVDLCHQHLSRQPKNGDSTFKVVYIIGTGNKDKLINMELDMQKKLKHVRLELSVDIEFLGILAWMFPLASPDSLLASCKLQWHRR